MATLVDRRYRRLKTLLRENRWRRDELEWLLKAHPDMPEDLRHQAEAMLKKWLDGASHDQGGILSTELRGQDRVQDQAPVSDHDHAPQAPTG